MKDEIKEILDNKLYFDLEEEDYIKIKDYITNLQEENEKVHKDFNELSERYFFTKSRNKKAREYIKSLCYIESKNEWFTYGDDLSPEHIVNILNGDDE